MKTIFNALAKHHRGQISIMLDMPGVDNDYSSLMNRI